MSNIVRYFSIIIAKKILKSRGKIAYAPQECGWNWSFNDWIIMTYIIQMLKNFQIIGKNAQIYRKNNIFLKITKSFYGMSNNVLEIFSGFFIITVHLCWQNIRNIKMGI